MPRHCCVPGCKSNYSSQEYISIFAFPSDPDLKEKWIQQIGRKDYVVNKNSVVCVKHFQPHFVVTVDCVKRDDGTLLCVPRTKPKLQNDAFPTIFPNASSSLSKTPRKIKAVSGILDTQDSHEHQNSVIKDSITSFKSLCKEINSHIHHRNSTSDLSIASHNVDRTQYLQPPEETDQGEAAYITFRLEFLEQQRKYMHTFTDHYIDRMIREGLSWAKNRVANKPGFTEMCQNLDKAVEFLCLMCEELSSTITADTKDEKLARAKHCKTSVELADLASGDESLSPVSASSDRKQTLTCGQATGMYCCPHCSTVFPNHSMLYKHITEAHSIGSSKESPCSTDVSAEYSSKENPCSTDVCAEYSSKTVNKASCHKDDVNIKLKHMDKEILEIATESCDIQTDGKTSSRNAKKGNRTVQKASCADEISGRLYVTDDSNTDGNQTRSRTVKKSYKSDIVNTGYKTTGRLQTQKRKPFQCSLCDAGFNRTFQLKVHLSKHTGVKPFHCDVCGVGFSYKHYMQIHMRKHTGETPYVCDDCGAKFVNRRKLKIHRITHTGEKPYKCDVCGAGFNRPCSLKVHKRRHTGETPYTCDICGVQFADKCSLEMHRTRHTREKPCRCDVCGVGFTNYMGLQVHKSRHQGVKHKPYMCEICGLKLSSYCCLQNHKRKHTGDKPYVCDICAVTFSVKTSLINHIRKHTGETPYSCDICGLRFSVITSLQTHLRKHTGEKPYMCDTCGTEFAHSSTLRDHKRLHTGEKPYRCRLCGASFSNRKKFQRHRKVHAGENVYASGVSGLELSENNALLVV